MFCQKCRTPLTLDSSLENLSPAAFSLLTDVPADNGNKTESGITQSSRRLFSPLQKELYDHVSQNAGEPIIKRNLPAAADTGNMSFIDITKSQVDQSHAQKDQGSTTAKAKAVRRNGDEGSALSSQMERAARLFEILSSRTDIDHPICTECTDLLIEGMEKRLANANSEKDAYSKFLKEMSANVPTEEERSELEKELTESRKKEKEAMAELKSLEAEKAALERELADLELEAKELDKEEAEFWRERNAFSQQLAEFQNERDSINTRYEHDTRQLDRLARTNVFNDTFTIGHDGYFGTINGLRLGRMSGVTVEWTEINAALGQSCLLLATVADLVGCELKGYRLNPIGSTSTVETIENAPGASTLSDGSNSKGGTSTLNLYHSVDVPLNIGFLHRNFHDGLVAFLECINQVGKHIENLPAARAQDGKSYRLPYEIKKDKLCARGAKDQEYSIKPANFGGDENWTRACKYMLTCLKFLLACAAHMER